MMNVATWLYGSSARGDSTECSDVDVLVVGGEPPEGLSYRFCGRRLSLSRYSWPEFQHMVSYGSLFAQHIKQEGRPLDQSQGSTTELPALLSTLPPYRYVQRDIRAFQASVDDIREECSSPVSLPFELANVAALVRRIGILGAYVDGKPSFGRYEPVTHIVENWSLATSIALEFPALYQFRLAAQGASVALTGNPSHLLQLWLARAQTLLDALKERYGESSD